jgi:hypothetical protein
MLIGIAGTKDAAMRAQETSERPAALAGRMGNFLSEEEIATYHREGYVVPRYRLPADELARLQVLTLEFVAENPHLQNKQVVCPHIPQKWVRDINVSNASALEWQKFARNPAILDMAESILGFWCK